MKKLISFALAGVLALSLLGKLPTVSHADDITPPATTQPSEPTEPTLPQPPEGGMDSEPIMGDGWCF